MGSRNVWILLLLVLALGGVVLWQQGREERHEFDSDVALFDGVRPERVQSVRIDHLERGLQLALARDAGGTWQIVDPLAFPAEGGVLERLLEVVEHNRAIPVPQQDLASVSLSPPRAVLELVEKLPEGERTTRLELGALDIDGKHVFARVDGRVVRTLRNLDSTLDRDVDDWRRRRVLLAEPTSVVELTRTGNFALDPEAGAIDFTLAAGETETGWRATAPWNTALEPGMVGALLTNVCFLQARSFLADSAAEAALFGLDRPDLRLVLGLANDAQETLLFKRDPRTESWSCMREGSTHVFRVDDVAVVYLAVPADGFLDPKLARVAQADVQRIELQSGGGALQLARDGLAWKLSRAGTGGDVRADADAVLDLLGALESARAAKFLVDEGPATFVAAQPALGLRLQAAGATFGVDFGAEREVSPGVPGRLFRRLGDDLVGVVPARIAELAASDWSHFVDRQLVKLPELAIARIELARGELRRSYVRDGESGRWSPAGVDAQAPKEFLRCVDRLLSLRADVIVSPSAPFELAEPWEVAVVDGAQIATRYRIGPLASDPAAQGFDDGARRGIVTSTGLWTDLARIP